MLPIAESKLKMEHGGDIYRKQVDLDFSVNLNPLGTPESILRAVRNSAEHLSVYPDPAQDAVRRAIASFEGISVDAVIAGSGASELLLAVVRAVRPQRALLFEPAFTGYTHGLKAARCRIHRAILRASDGFRMQEDALTKLSEFLRKRGSGISGGQDLLILCDPANPTGRSIDERVLLTLLDQTQRLGVPVLLDESFFLLSDKAELVRRDRSRKLIEAYEHLFLLRSLTKIFAMPGIRAGYVLSASKNIEALKAQLPEWNIAAPAEAAITEGCRVLAETDFSEKSRAYVREEREYLAEKLQQAGLTVQRGEAPYLLLHGPGTLGQELLDRRILIRDCSGFPGLGRGWFRIAVRDHTSNETLIKVIREITEEET